MNETRTSAVQHLEEVEILHQQLAQKERQYQQLKEAFRESGERFNLLIEHAPEAIVLVDVDTFRFIDCNENALRLYGLKREKLLKVGPIEVSPPIQPDGCPSSESAREKAQQGLCGKPVVFEWMHRNAAGEEVLCEIRLIRLTASGRHLLRGSISDIRERKKLEESLKERLQFETLLSKLSATFVNLPTQTFDTELKHGIQQIVEFFGADRGALIEFSEDRQQILTTHTWAIQGIEPLPLGILKVEFPWSVGKLRNGVSGISDHLVHIRSANGGDCFMDKLSTYRTYIQQLLEQLGEQLPTSETIETQYIFDKEHDHYQLFQVGWDQYEWTHGCIMHLDIKQGKIWVQHNGTELGIAEELLTLGVPKEDIVLGFQAPYKRKYTGFAEG